MDSDPKAAEAPACLVRPGAQVPELGGAGIPEPGPAVDLRLDGNLGSRPAAALLQRCLDDVELVRAYPSGRSLENALAERHAVAPEQIVLTAGADEALDRICRAVLAPGRRAVVPVPTFEMLERYVALTGATTVRIAWDGGAWPLARVLAAIDATTALVAIVSPNNPTGAVASAADVAAVLRAAPHALVVVDAAYAEYADEDLGPAALAAANGVLLRTFSKAYGLAGLRIGYAVAHPRVARWLRAVGSPFTAGRLARAVALARLADPDGGVRAHVAAVRAHRAELTRHLQELGADVVASRANFVFARHAAAALVHELLAGLGIAVRLFRSAGDGTAAGGLRITVPDDAGVLARLGAALGAALRPEAIVLDLDGVLADLEGRRPLLAAPALAALAAIVPLGVVTSCPRRLCDSVLLRYGFAPHVRAAVVAEDGPGKPDPFPVRRALERLGVRRAWMLGDNTVDVLAARGAGVVPFAVDPGAVRGAHAAALRAAGAARLVRGVDELTELLRLVLGAHAGEP